MAVAHAVRSAAIGRLDRIVGGPARRQVVVALAAVLALDSADKATVGTNATQLESALGIGTAGIGLLLTVSSLVGAAAAIPFGMLVDRQNRTRLLTMAIALWSFAMVLSGVATGFVFLLLARVALGAVVAVAGPAIASLIGDYFPQSDRARVYSYVLSGELIGAGFGFVVAGEFATLSWRAPFFVLVAPGVLVWFLVRRLPEPERGGASRLPVGAEDIRTAGNADDDRGQPAEKEPAETATLAHQAVRNIDVQPRQAAVLDRSPDSMSLLHTVRYVLSVRTNVVLIVASALGYFFFSGLRGFAVEFTKLHYGVSQSMASLLTVALGVGALLGVLAGGRLADRLLRNGQVAGRVVVPGWAVLVAAALFVPALLTGSLGMALPLLMSAALCLGAANPPLDAARLDIIHPGAWGRAEAVRTVLRSCADACAPLLFGVLAENVFGGNRGAGLQHTFLLALSVLIAASLITLLLARRTYPSDVAAAAESMKRTGAAQRPSRSLKEA